MYAKSQQHYTDDVVPPAWEYTKHIPLGDISVPDDISVPNNLFPVTCSLPASDGADWIKALGFVERRRARVRVIVRIYRMLRPLWRYIYITEIDLEANRISRQGS